jgi:hypothetical protein
MEARPRTDRGKTLRLAGWNADDVGGRKLELEHFLNQHSVYIYLSSETFLNPGHALRLANYVYHCRLAAGGGTTILVHRAIIHQTLPVPGLTRPKANAIQNMLAGKPVIIIAA